jgi:hypothetical protein
MKTKEEILDNTTYGSMYEIMEREELIKAMEEYADEVTLGKTLQIHARDQQIEKYKGLIEAYEEFILNRMPSSIYWSDENDDMRGKIEQLKTELGL